MKWIRTLEGEHINLDNIVELRVTTSPSNYKFKGRCCVIAESSNWAYYLWAETVNEYNEENVIKRAEMFIDALIAEAEGRKP
jgi:hypothetical protein